MRLGRADGRRVILATVLGSGMALLDVTAVNVALPTIGRQLGAGISGLQWIVTGYTLTLAALILLGGSLGDRLGRRRVFLAGVAWFAVSSALCGLAPGIGVLVAARVLQGAGGALLVPGSLAIIQATFAAQDRPRAIGAWSGLSGLASAAGPLFGGWLVTSAGWRWVFLLNVPVAALVIAVTARGVPESRDENATARFDVLGAWLAALALAGITYALVGGPSSGMSGRAGLIVGGCVGLAAGAAFVAVERARGRPGRRGNPGWPSEPGQRGQPAGPAKPGAREVPAPMLPLDLFSSRQFTVINLITFCVYAALGGVMFLLVLQLQVGAGFSALRAGAAMLPVTVAMLILSPRSAGLAQRVGPRWVMTAGLIGCAGGVLSALRISDGARYLTDVLPAVGLFGLGISFVVAPLTATVLASAQVRHAGVASGVNNAVARAAALLAVAGLPAAAGLRTSGYRSPVLLGDAFRTSMVICAGLLAVAAVLAITLIDDRVLEGSDAGQVARVRSSVSGRRGGTSDTARSGA